jgi:hypothetical protein
MLRLDYVKLGMDPNMTLNCHLSIQESDFLDLIGLQTESFLDTGLKGND